MQNFFTDLRKQSLINPNITFHDSPTPTTALVKQFDLCCP